MAQADYIVANGTGAAVRSDLNGQLAAIVSNNSGATEPATMYAYQWWADTTAGLLKIRNAANNAWITLRELDGTLLMEDGTAAAPGLSFASDLDTAFSALALMPLASPLTESSALSLAPAKWCSMTAAPTTTSALKATPTPTCSLLMRRQKR
jgi:hypothetical protein